MGRLGLKLRLVRTQPGDAKLKASTASTASLYLFARILYTAYRRATMRCSCCTNILHLHPVRSCAFSDPQGSVLFIAASSTMERDHIVHEHGVRDSGRGGAITNEGQLEGGARLVASVGAPTMQHVRGVDGHISG